MVGGWKQTNTNLMKSDFGLMLLTFSQEDESAGFIEQHHADLAGGVQCEPQQHHAPQLPLVRLQPGRDAVETGQEQHLLQPPVRGGRSSL